MIKISDRFWVGGTDTWNATAGTKWATTSGGAGGAAVPTSADDVYFDAASGAVTVSLAVSGTVTARSIDFTGFTGTFATAGASTIVIGTSTTKSGNVALKVVSGMTWTNNGGTIQLSSTSTTQQTADFGGKTVSSVTFQGTGSNWLLSSDLTSATTVTFNGGTINTNGKNVTCATLAVGSTTFTPGSSSFTVNGTNSQFQPSASTTWSSNTATITMSGSGARVFLTNKDYNGLSISMTGSGTVRLDVASGTATLANFTRTGTVTKTDQLSITSTGSLTCTGTFTCTGNSTVNRVLVTTYNSTVGYSTASPVNVTITAAAVSISNVNFMDITGAGAGSWSGTSIGDCGGNSGITFTTAVTRYAVAPGNWSDTAMWSTSSGGSGGSSVPLPQDDVVMDSSSAAGTYTIDMPHICKNWTMTGFTRTISCSLTDGTAFSVYGNVALGPFMTWSTSGYGMSLRGRGTHTFTSNSKSVNCYFEVIASGGSYTIQDSLTSTYSSAASLSLFDGSFNCSSYSLTLSGSFLSSGSRTRALNGGTSTITVATGWSVSGSNDTWTMGSSTIAFTSSSSARTFTGGGKTYGTLNYTVAGSTGSLTITGSNTFGIINFSDASNARTLLLTSGTTTTILNAFNVNGTAGKLMSVNAVTAASAATLSMAAGTSSNDYLSIKDITATGGAAWYAGANSTNVSGNTGWIFSAVFVPIVAMFG